MKKLLSAAIICSLALSFVTFSPVMADESGTSSSTETSGAASNSESSLERISSPDMIRYFKNIVKRGTALFGIRKEIRNEVKEGDLATSTALKLEKILAPQFINMYEKIQKIGSSLWGYKKGGNKNSGNKATSTYVVITSDAASCVSTAIGTKDSALISNNSTFTSELNAAISARTTCQTTAISSTENQKQNLDACVKAFKDARKQASDKAIKNHKDIWKTFRDSLKSCRSSQTSTSTSSSVDTGEIIIEDGGGSITEAAVSEE